MTNAHVSALFLPMQLFYVYMETGTKTICFCEAESQLPFKINYRRRVLFTTRDVQMNHKNDYVCHY